MLSRTQAEVESPEPQEGMLEEAREALSKQLHREDHLQQSMLERVQEEIGQ
jgi:hypothetical protein